MGTIYHVTAVTDLGGKRVYHVNDPGRQAVTPRRFAVQISDGRDRVLTRDQLIALVKRGRTITYVPGVAEYLPRRVRGTV